MKIYRVMMEDYETFAKEDRYMIKSSFISKEKAEGLLKILEKEDRTWKHRYYITTEEVTE